MRLAIYAPGAPLEGDVVVLPPGLAGAPPVEALRAFARAGGRLLGLADGVASLCAAGLLPGAVSSDGAAATHVRVEGRATPFTWAMPAGRIVALDRSLPGARFAATDAEVLALAARGQIVLRACDASGGLASRGVGDAAATVAGLCDETGQVVGVLVPVAPAFDSELGRQLLASLRGRYG